MEELSWARAKLMWPSVEQDVTPRPQVFQDVLGPKTQGTWSRTANLSGGIASLGIHWKISFPRLIILKRPQKPLKMHSAVTDKAGLPAVSKKRSPTPQMHTEAVFWEADQYAGEFRTDLLFNTTAEDIPPDSLISPKLWNTEDYSIPSTGWCNAPDTPGTQEESGSPTSS